MRIPLILLATLCLTTTSAAPLTRLGEREFGRLDDGTVVK